MNYLAYAFDGARYLRRSIRSALSVAYLNTHGASTGRGVVLNGRPRLRIAAGSRVLLGDDVVLTSDWRKNELDAPSRCTIRTLASGAIVKIGNNTGLTSAVISAAGQIEIGARCLLGSGVVITDTDFHPVKTSLLSPRRFQPRPTFKEVHSVVIGNDVFIGSRSIILKGTTIGDNSVVGAGSVLRGAYPENVVIMGNPGVVVASIDGEPQ